MSTKHGGHNTKGTTKGRSRVSNTLTQSRSSRRNAYKASVTRIGMYRPYGPRGR